jgi:cold shock CspA family protein
VNVRIDGRLIKWNDDRGFGFIQDDSGGPEVFVHISAFQKTGGRPRLGERVSFEIAMGDDGKKRAVAVVPVERPPPRRARVGAPEKTSVPGMLASAALVLAIGVGIYRFVETRFPGARIARRCIPAPRHDSSIAIAPGRRWMATEMASPASGGRAERVHVGGACVFSSTVFMPAGAVAAYSS